MNLLIGVLATFGLAALVTNYDGPLSVFISLRSKYRVFECTVCLSVWIAPVILALLALGATWLVWSCAVVGAVILLERLS